MNHPGKKWLGGSHPKQWPLTPWIFLSLLWATLQPCWGGGWYVGTVAAGEWIEYKHVWLAAGSYRFTAHAGATAGGATIHLEIDGTVARPNVAVPNTGRQDRFGDVHLGSVALAQGYHDLRIVFETAGTSVDWFTLRKDSSTSTTVDPADTAIVRPPTDGMLVGPIVGFEHKESGIAGGSAYVPNLKDKSGNVFSDAQLTAWYGVPMYRDYDRRTDRYWDVMVDELMASRAQVPLFHCRETIDFTHDLQDRRYQEGGGAYEGRWLKKLAEAVGRSPQAMSSLKIGMFWENGGIATGFYAHYGYYPAWGDPAFADYVMQYWLGPWFDNVPPEMIYQPLPGRPIVRIYSMNPGSVVQDGNSGGFLAAVRQKMISRYGFNPLFVISSSADTGARNEAWGVSQWVTWDGPLFTSYAFGGTYWGTASSGSRRRIDTVWLNDWNPATNTGTPAGDSPGHDSHQSRLDAQGNSSFWNPLNQAKNLGVKLVGEEGFTNISEGNSIFRSCHSEWVYPNQHLGVMREFADPKTETLLFEAEDCDTYLKLTASGNKGGSYRRQWYSPTDMDVYRPLHNLQAWTSKNAGPGNLVQLEAGFYDVWGIDSGGQLWAREINGNPDRWSLMPDTLKFTSVSLSHGPGNLYAWGMSGGSVYSCSLPGTSDAWNHGGWTKRTGSIVQVSAGRWEVWGLDASGNVYRRPIDGTGSWVQAAGTMNRISVEDAFIWGMQGTHIYYALTSAPTLTWIECPNPFNLTQVKVASEEVWGTNAAGQIYRRSASGAGDWELVDGNLSSLTVGENYVWGLSGSAVYCRKLEGFSNGGASAASAPMLFPPSAESGRVSLAWTPSSGAASYRVKRAAASGGPYAAVSTPSGTSYSDTGLLNGTTYYYVVTAVNSNGESIASAEVHATPRAIPSAPGNLVATAVSVGQINLTWQDNASDEAGFLLERKTGANGAYGVIGAFGAGAVAFSDVTLSSGTPYFYRVRAFNDGGESGYSNEAGATTQGGATLFINFQPIASAVVPGYLVDGGQLYASRANGLSYGWSIDNSGQARDRNVSSDQRIDTMVPFRTGATWEISVPNGSYSVKISVGDTSGTYVQTLSAEGTSYWNAVSVGPACANATRTVTVADGKLTLSNGAAADNATRIDYIEISPLAAPAVPSGLAAARGNGQASLSWTPGMFATGYNVKRSATSGGPYASVASTTSSACVDTGLVNGSTYYYVVSAVNSFGESANSPAVPVTPQNVNTALYEAEGAVVVGAAVANGSAGFTGSGYVDYINSTGDYIEWTASAASAGTATLEFRYAGTSNRPLALSINGVVTVSSLAFPGTGGSATWGVVTAQAQLQAGTNTIRLTATGSSGNNFDSLKITSTGSQSPAAPAGLTAVAGQGQVTLGWNAPAGASSYQIKRSSVPGGPYQQIAASAQTSFTDTGLLANAHYYYVVSATTAANASSPNSSEIDAVPLPLLADVPTGVGVVAGESRATLGWTSAAGAASYNVWRSTSSGGPYTALASAESAGYVDTAVVNGQTYFYEITALNAGGQSASSPPLSATPQLLAPGELAAAAVSESQIRLTWNNYSANATANLLQRSPHAANAWTTVSQLAADAATHTVPGLNASTSYDFRLQAIDAASGASPYASVTAATPAGIGDGIPGWWRFLYFGDGLATTPQSEAGADPDADGMSNQQEYTAGTIPTDGSSVFRMKSLSPQGNDIVLTFDSVSGKTYVVERALSLGANTAWTAVRDDIPGTGASISVTDSGALQRPAAFYRVRLK